MFDEFNSVLGDATYGNTANLDPDSLVSDQITLAFFAFDTSPSMGGVMSELNDARQNCIAAWKKSHHADSILYSECTFSDTIDMKQGFDMVSTINPSTLTCDGSGTALFEATLLGLQRTYNYKKQLEASGASVKCMVFVFTDGQNNEFKVVSSHVIDYLNQLHASDESTFSDFETFIISIEKNTNKYFQEMKTDLSPVGVKIIVPDPNDKRSIAEILRENITVVSQSVSSGSTGNLNNIVI